MECFLTLDTMVFLTLDTIADTAKLASYSWVPSSSLYGTIRINTSLDNLRCNECLLLHMFVLQSARPIPPRHLFTSTLWVEIANARRQYNGLGAHIWGTWAHKVAYRRQQHVSFMKRPRTGRGFQNCNIEGSQKANACKKPSHVTS